MAREAMKKKRMEKTQHIINIATEVFAEKGYHGALTDEIADRAKISKRSMYYYVGDKDTLYEAVIKKLMDQVAEYLSFEIKDNETVKNSMRRYIRGLAEVSKMQQLHAIVLREFFNGGKNIPASLAIDTSKSLENFFLIFEKGKNEGVFSDDIDPFLVTWMIFSFFIHWQITMPHLYEAGMQKERIDKLGVAMNPKLIKEVEKLFDKMISPSK